MNKLCLLALVLFACSSTPSVVSDSWARADASFAPSDKIVYSIGYGPYPIAPGEEGVDCLDQSGPSADTWVSGWHARSTFAHHVNIWERTDGTPFTAPTACATATIPGTGFFGVEMPDLVERLDEAPEYAGLGFLLPRAGDLLWNVHKLDANSTPGSVAVRVDFFEAKRHDLVAHGFSLNNSPSLNVPAGQTVTLTYSTVSPPSEIRIFSVSMHVHAHDRLATFSIGGTEIYRLTDWASAPYAHYDSLHGGDLVVPASTKVEWTCEIVNTTASALRFANSIQGGEMCIVYGLMIGPSWKYTAP